MRAYKVFAKIGDELKSITPSSYRIIYSPNKTHRAKVGPLFIFKRKKDALEFAGWRNNSSVWRVEVDRMAKLNIASVLHDELDIFWEKHPPFSRKSYYNEPWFGTLPVGTYGCKSVRLIKEIL